MFSGIIEAIGRIRSLNKSEAGGTLEIETPIARELSTGQSIAVNGVCLTVVETGAQRFSADLSTETLKRTTFSFLSVDEYVNLERPLAVGAPLGGHFVQGHVDAVGRIQAKRTEGETTLFEIVYPKDVSAYFVEKGSIAVDGISLTIAGLKERSFEVAIVPYTLERTTLKYGAPGRQVNLECDILAKYICRFLEVRGL